MHVMLHPSFGYDHPQTSPGIAGGEKRRLSIACALIAQPSLLFLDEPTTGLDSFAALNVMEHLSSLAAQGHTIVASIHQPRSVIWDMFHKVWVSLPTGAAV